MLPIVTMIGIQYGYSLGGEVLVEQIFSWPGIGRYSVDAIFNLDYAAVQGFVLIVATLYIVIYLFVDVVYAVLDPRIQV
jgi:ABC-type dipeptide/oligopeptide/nickel transport system permease component